MGAVGNFLTRARANLLYFTVVAAAALEAVVNRATSYLGIGDAVYDLDAMPAAYEQYLLDNDLEDSDGQRLQWCVDRLTLSDDGLTAVFRNVKVLIGGRVYDVTDMPLQETGTLGTYGTEGATYGTRKGANAQILLPATGSLHTGKGVTLTFAAKHHGFFGYSVVNGNNTNVMPTSAVIKSDLAGMGSARMIGASRALDGYAGLYLSNIAIRIEGVTFRTTEGLTAFDMSHCFTWQGGFAIADTGSPSHLLRDPRRKADGTWFVWDGATQVTPDGDECAFEDRQFGFIMPKLWNGGHLSAGEINVQGFRYGVGVHEHAHINYIFANYNFVGVKLFGMSHTAVLNVVKVQRCPIGIEGPEAGGWFGNDPACVVVVNHYGGESYHPGEFGNPAGARWYSHRYRFRDPNNLWTGSIEYFASSAELPTNPSYPTIPDGEGENLVIRRIGDGAWRGITEAPAQVDVTPDLETLDWVAGCTVTAPAADALEAILETQADSDGAVVLPALSHGQKFRLYLKHSGDGNDITITDPSGYTVMTEGTLSTGVDNRLDIIRGSCIWTGSPVRKIIELELVEGVVISGLTTEAGAGTLVLHDTFTGAAGNLHGHAPDTNDLGTFATWNDSLGYFDLDGSGWMRSKFTYGLMPAHDLGFANGEIEITCAFRDATAGAFMLYFNSNGDLDPWNEETAWRVRIAQDPVGNGGEGWVYVEDFNGPAGGSFTQYGTTYDRGAAFAQDESFKVKVRFNDNQLALWVDDVQVFSITVSGRQYKTNTYFYLKPVNDANRFKITDLKIWSL
jgi:hypothetical protein